MAVSADVSVVSAMAAIGKAVDGGVGAAGSCLNARGVLRSHELESAFERGAQRVSDENMHLLDALGVLRRHDEQRIGKTDQVAAIAAGERRRGQPFLLPQPKRPDNIGAAARGRNADPRRSSFTRA